VESGTYSTPDGTLWGFRVTTDSVAGIAVVSPVGRIDARSAPAFAKALNESARESRRLLVDLGQVSYISSAGLSAVGAVLKELDAGGGTLAVCAVTDPVRLAFDLAGLLDQLNPQPSRDAGLQALGGGAHS
jgi:anti-anti-sigma factor